MKHDYSKKIIVVNNNTVVFRGTAQKFIEINGNDEVVTGIVDEALLHSGHEIEFIGSGKWEILIA